MFGDHLAVGIGHECAVGSASASPGFIGQHECSPKQCKIGHVIRVGLGASRDGANKGSSDQNTGAEQHRPSLHILHGRARYPSNR
jgi:hypothetical protein